MLDGLMKKNRIMRSRPRAMFGMRCRTRAAYSFRRRGVTSFHGAAAERNAWSHCFVERIANAKKNRFYVLFLKNQFLVAGAHVGVCVSGTHI